MADIYRIGVAIGVSGNAAEALQALTSKVLGLNVAVKDLQGSFNRVKLAALGLAGVYTSRAIFHGFNEMAEAGARLQTQQTAMAQAGMTHLQIVQETAEAYRSLTRVRGAGSVADRNAATRELRGIVGAGLSGRDMSEVNAIFPNYLKLRTLYGEQGSQDIVRAVEQQGGARYLSNGQIDESHSRFIVNGRFDEASFDRHLGAAVRTLQASGGNIKPRDLLNVMQMASVTARGMDPDAFWNTIMTPILEMGGYRAGTAMTAVSRAFYGGIMPERNARELERLGVYTGRHVQHMGHMSREQMADMRAHGYTINRDHTVSIGRDALVGADELNDPHQGLYPWVRDQFLPALQRDYQQRIAHRPGNHETFDAYVRDELYQALPTETARRIIALLVTQGTSVQRDQTARAQATGLGAYDLAQQNYDQQRKNFSQSLESLRETLGMPAAQDGAHILQLLGTGIDHLTQVLARNPGLATSVERLGIATGVLTGAFGVVAIGIAITSMFRLSRATQSLAVSMARSAEMMEAAEITQGAGAGGRGVRGVLRGAAAMGLAGGTEYLGELTYDSIVHRHEITEYRHFMLSHPDYKPSGTDERLHPWLYRDRWAPQPQQNPADKPKDQHKTATQQHVHVTTHLHLDGKKIAKHIQHISAAQSGQTARASGSQPSHLEAPPLPGH